MTITSRGRLALAVLTSAVGVLAGVTAAEAKVYFGDLDGKTLRWDERVSSTIANCPGNASCMDHVEGIVVYLRPGPRARSRPDMDTLRRVGRVTRNGTIRFRVPHVRRGRYHLLARVPTDTGGRWFPVSGSFRIRR